MILAAIKGDYGLQRIAQHLRNQWSDEDIRRRDQSHGSGWWIDDDDYEIPNDLTDSAWHRTDDLNEEGAALMNEAEQDAQEALALLVKSKRTLKDARDRQHQVRMSRKYFRTSFKTSSGEGRSRDYKSNTRRLRCGGDHKTFQCPKPGPGASASTAESQSAPFVCFAGVDPDPPASDCLHAEDDAFLSTPEVVAGWRCNTHHWISRGLGSCPQQEPRMSRCLRSPVHRPRGSSSVWLWKFQQGPLPINCFVECGCGWQSWELEGSCFGPWGRSNFVFNRVIESTGSNH